MLLLYNKQIYYLQKTSKYPHEEVSVGVFGIFFIDYKSQVRHNCHFLTPYSSSVTCKGSCHLCHSKLRGFFG